MITNQTAPQNIDDYIAGFPPDIQAILNKLPRRKQRGIENLVKTITPHAAGNSTRCDD